MQFFEQPLLQQKPILLRELNGSETEACPDGLHLRPVHARRDVVVSGLGQHVIDKIVARKSSQGPAGPQRGIVEVTTLGAVVDGDQITTFEFCGHLLEPVADFEIDYLGAVPDPQDPATFERSKLDWSELESERGRRMLSVYRDLTRLRREHTELTDPSFAHVACKADEAARFFTLKRGSLLVLVNFGDRPMAVELGKVDLLFETESGVHVAGGVVRLPSHAGALVRLPQH